MSTFQPCHIAPALVTASHLPGPTPRAASVQKGRAGGADWGAESSCPAMGLPGQPGQDRLLEHEVPALISELIPRPGRRQLGFMLEFLWLTHSSGAQPEMEQVPGFAACTARPPKTGPSCFRKQCLDQGVHPRACCSPKPSARRVPCSAPSLPAATRVVLPPAGRGLGLGTWLPQVQAALTNPTLGVWDLKWENQFDFPSKPAMP